MRMMEWARAHVLPKTLFGRLAWLLVAVVLASHFLALKLMFELGPDLFGPGRPRPPPPLLSQAITGIWQQGMNRMPPPRHMLPGVAHWSFWMDVGIRLSALLIAAWVGARWLAEPVRRLALAAQALGRDVQRAPLIESGTLECREAIRVFNKMQARICKQLEERDTFVAAVSHDLRTPLTRMALRLESLEASDLRQQFAQDITDMECMISSTLDYMRGVAEAEPLVLLDVDSLLCSVADDCVVAGQAVAVEYGEGLALASPLMIQAQALRRCIGNLVDNAVRYGGSARLCSHERDGHVRIEVVDDGPGVLESDLDKILLPFYRVERSRNRHSGGLGLGLAIASDIAQRLGGTLHLKNRAEGGLIASVVFPLATPHCA